MCGLSVAHARSTACCQSCEFVWAGGGRGRSSQPHVGWWRSSWPAASDLKQRCSFSPSSSAAFTFFPLPAVASPAILIVCVAAFHLNSRALLQPATSVFGYQPMPPLHTLHLLRQLIHGLTKCLAKKMYACTKCSIIQLAPLSKRHRVTFYYTSVSHMMIQDAYANQKSQGTQQH